MQHHWYMQQEAKLHIDIATSRIVTLHSTAMAASVFGWRKWCCLDSKDLLGPLNIYSHNEDWDFLQKRPDLVFLQKRPDQAFQPAHITFQDRKCMLLWTSLAVTTGRTKGKILVALWQKHNLRNNLRTSSFFRKTICFQTLLLCACICMHSWPNGLKCLPLVLYHVLYNKCTHLH